MPRSFSSVLLIFYSIFHNTTVLSFDTFKEIYCWFSDTSLQSWATRTTPKRRAQLLTRVGQVRSEYHSGKLINVADRYIQLYRPSLVPWNGTVSR